MTEEQAGPSLREARVTVVGLGLMGGSMALALRGQCRALTGVVRDAAAGQVAQSRGVVDEATTELEAAVREADIVVLATPVRTILELLVRLRPALHPNCLVMDLGSTKREIVAAMGELPSGVQAVGGHPMCGKEVAGLESADGSLFQDCVFVLCPPAGSGPGALRRAGEVVRAVGARPLVMDAGRHDRLVAAVSHLPYLLSAALVATAEATAEEDPLLPVLAANGFRDTSRLAGSDVSMMRDILLTNKAPVTEQIDECLAWLAAMRAQVQAGDGPGIEATLAAVQRQQRRLLE